MDGDLVLHFCVELILLKHFQFIVLLPKTFRPKVSVSENLGLFFNTSPGKHRP